MTAAGRVNLADLRELASWAALNPGPDGRPEVCLLPAEVLALVDAVEAAQALLVVAPAAIPRGHFDQAKRALADALARFEDA